MTFVSIPQPSEYAFQYAELQAAEIDPVALFEVLNTKEEWDKIGHKTPPTKLQKTY